MSAPAKIETAGTRRRGDLGKHLIILGLLRALAKKVVDTLSGPEVWMVDETSFPKAGAASVGVARQ